MAPAGRSSHPSSSQFCSRLIVSKLTFALGNASAVGEGRVPPGFSEKARLAIANCSELAIEIIED
jgi:hypothetical protein